MPTRDKTIIGAPCWVDLMSKDVAASREFYSQLFGWTAEEPSEEFGGYFMFSHNGAPVAGAMSQMADSTMPDAWSIYLATKDTRAIVERAKAHGGTVIVDPMQVGNLGVMGVVSDAGGAAIGLWQPMEFPGGMTYTEHATPGWFQLNTRDYDSSLAFYRDVLGWEYQILGDAPGFHYAAISIGNQTYAGIMDASAFLPEAVPAHWVVYFWVDDTDVALAKAVELGGTVIMPADDSPYGRLATATDSTGAMFNLMAPNDQMPARRS